MLQHIKMSRRSLLSFVLLAIAFASTARADSTSWINPLGGLWSEVANWDNGVPDSTHMAFIQTPGTYTVTIDEPAFCPALQIGSYDSSGVQTLEVLDSLTVTFSWDYYNYVLIQVDSNGTIDLYGDLVMTGDTTDEENWYAYTAGTGPGGVFVVHDSATVTGFWSSIVNGGLLEVHGSGFVDSDQLDGQVLNIGYMDVINANNAFVKRIDNFALDDGSPDYLYEGELTIDGSLAIESVVNEGVGRTAVIDVFPGAVVTVLNVYTLEYGYYQLVNWTLGNLRIWAGAEIRREYTLPQYPNFGAVYNAGGVITLPRDSAYAVLTARVESYGSEAGQTVLDSANLDIYEWGRIADSVSIAAICTLFAAETRFDSIDKAVEGSGTLFFTEDSCAIRQQFPFSGRVLLRDVDTIETFVDFDPPGSALINFGTLGLLDSFTRFAISNTDTIRVDTVTQLGGIISGATIVNDICDWRAGTVTADTAAEFLILPGCALTMWTAGPKTLDSLPLHIEGTATLQDEGVLTLLDSAVVNVAPGGAMDVLSGFEMDGVGTLYNSGWTNFDPQGDTIRILVPVINSTAARTPGTIDVLSAPVVWNSSGWNGADLNLNSASQLLLNASLRNAAGGSITCAGGHLVVNDTLWNDDAGLVNLFDGALIDGGGMVMNGGTIVSGGGVLMSVTNNMMSASLLNLPDSGQVNVIADTLTVTGTVTNQDTITIHAGAVLRVLGVLLNDVTGVINGNGTLDVSEAVSFVNNGTIAPGLSPGSLTIVGDLALGATSRLEIELGGQATESYDHLTVTGTLQLGGTLAFSSWNGYIPQPNDELNLLTFADATGDFSAVSGNDLGNGQFLSYEIGPNGVTLAVLAGLQCIIARDATEVRLHWTRIPGATAYTIYAAPAFDGAYQPVHTATAPDTFATVEAAGEVQFYRITAVLP